MRVRFVALAGTLLLSGCAAPVVDGSERGPDPWSRPAAHFVSQGRPAFREPGARYGAAPSFLPNLGVQLSADWPLARTDAGRWRFEVQAVDQFLDDESFSNDGNPAAGNWTQLAAGWRLVRSPDSEESAEWFAGPIYFHARGKPNLVEKPGVYLGLRAGVGYLVHLTPNLVMGPEFSLVVAHGNRDDVIFPQIAWGIRWSPSPARAERLRSRP